MGGMKSNVKMANNGVMASQYQLKMANGVSANGVMWPSSGVISMAKCRNV